MRIGQERSASGLRIVRVLSLAVALIVGTVLVIAPPSAAEEVRGGVAKSVEGGEKGRIGNHLIYRLPADASAASPSEIRIHLVNENILGRFLTMKLRSVDRRCSYGYDVEPDFSITLEAFNINDESLLSECGQQLSNLLRTVEPNEIEFGSTRKAIADVKTRASSGQSTYLVLGVTSAAIEAYRHIYADGTPEKILADLDASDFENVQYDEFLNWYRKHFDGTTADAFSVAPDTPDLTVQHACKARPIRMVQQLDIAKSGWGQRAILLVDQGYSTAGAAGIANPTLRKLCTHPVQTVPAGDAVSDRLRGILNCRRQYVGNDKWLVVYSKEQPVASLDEMKDLAQTIASALGGETCSETRSRIYVVNFTGVP
jgi:hypothetical protein